METREFKIKGRTNSIVKLHKNSGVYFKNFISEYVLLGIIEKETKRGFYYNDMFFKKQFINWELLEEIKK